MNEGNGTWKKIENVSRKIKLIWAFSTLSCISIHLLPFAFNVDFSNMIYAVFYSIIWFGWVIMPILFLINLYYVIKSPHRFERLVSTLFILLFLFSIVIVGLLFFSTTTIN